MAFSMPRALPFAFAFSALVYAFHALADAANAGIVAVCREQIGLGAEQKQELDIRLGGSIQRAQGGGGQGGYTCPVVDFYVHESVILLIFQRLLTAERCQRYR